jgi:hypothetical protein
MATASSFVAPVDAAAAPPKTERAPTSIAAVRRG